MPWHPIKYERDKLYAELWAEPMQVVAKRYGVSDVALAKTCRKLDIPTPGRGYWARKHAGHEVEIEPLPSATGTTPTVLFGSHWREGFESELGADEVGELLEAVKRSEICSVLPELIDPHPLIAETSRILRKRRPGRERELREHPCFDLPVTRKTLDRALRVADALVKSLENLGLTVEATEPQQYNEMVNPSCRDPENQRTLLGVTGVHVFGSFIQFSIEEEIEKITIPPKPTEPARSPTYRHRLTGRLLLRIKTETKSGAREIWRDGKKRTVEDELSNFITALIRAGDYLRTKRLHEERQEREREDAERRRIQTEQERENLRRLADDLETRTKNWQQAQTMKAFLEDLDAHHPHREGEFASWFEWASDYVSRLESEALTESVKAPPPAR